MKYEFTPEQKQIIRDLFKQSVVERDLLMDFKPGMVDIPADNPIVTDVRYEFDEEKQQGFLKFRSHVGFEFTQAGLKSLMKAGLQREINDGEPDYFVTGTKEGLIQEVRWMYDPDKPFLMR